jgi:hypothetical protein
LSDEGVLVRLGRPEGYEDAHPQLVAEDAIKENWPCYDVLGDFEEEMNKC